MALAARGETMLKTKRGPQVWLITQPAHAELAGQPWRFIGATKSSLSRGTVKLTSLDQDEANQSEDQAAVTSAHTVTDRARSIR